jgi:hypothetical protein
VRRPAVGALVVVLALGACTSSPTSPTPGTPVTATAPGTEVPVTTPTTSAPTSAPTTPPTTTGTTVPDAPTTGTAVRMTVDGTTVDATLDDNPSARDLLTRLPLTLTVRDYNGVEKTAALAEPLTLDGAPRGADPAPFDIGYYAPDQVLVLYYRDVGFFNGIVALGRFDPAAAAVVEQQPDDSTVTIERA